MVYLLLGVFLSMLFFGIYLVLKKITLAQYYIAKHRSKKEKKKPAISRHTQQPYLVVNDIEAYEKQLFDDIAMIFMQRPPYSLCLEDAHEIQDEVLRKMPSKVSSSVRHLDLEEWSIYWQLEQQSLEYYVGHYGVFYAHVDRFGHEHTQVIQTDA
jgi:hypothetical protein